MARLSLINVNESNKDFTEPGENSLNKHSKHLWQIVRLGCHPKQAGANAEDGVTN
jgi:hypothetical protein